MNNLACPADEDLMPLLVGERTDSDLQTHVRDCTICRRRVDLFQSDLNALRSLPSIALSTTVSPVVRRPNTIGKYLVVGAIDSGGQSVVYRALHPTLDKELAIKLSHKAVGKLSDHRHLLVAEGKLLAKLEHPNLARIYDLDFHDDRPFLAMEYVRGETIKQLVDRAKPAPLDSAKLLAQIARALGVVHAHGVIHQDVKPQNILLDETGKPRLIDFGMARLRHAWDGSTQPDGGTPSFMAPEQARGEGTAIGPAADIFALGGVLYYMLTGRAPFKGKDVDETIAAAGRCDFDRTALLGNRIPRSLREICLKAMAPKPKDRYGRIEDMAADLERAVARPKRILRLVLIAVGVLTAAIVGIYLWQLLQPKPTSTAVPLLENSATELEVTVTRGEATLDLAIALPLDPTNDRLRVTARVPNGHHVLMLQLNSSGKVQILDPTSSPADKYTRYVFPGDGVAPLDAGPAGTEFILLVAAEDPNEFAGIADWIEKEMIGLLPLPAKTLIWLSRDEPRVTASFGPSQKTPVDQVSKRLDELRNRLRDKKLSVIRGVAYAR